MLEEGKKTPAFSLKDKDGEKHSLKNFEEDYLVLFFYPKDNTPGCTIESKGFSAMKKKFEKLDTKLIGISGGDERSKTKFCEKHNLTALMLSDTDFKLSEKLGIYGEKKFMGKTYMGISRSTFVVGPDRKILKVYNKVKPATHPQEVYDFIKGL